MAMMQEFKEFAMKGNVVDLAVGVIIGGAVTAQPRYVAPAPSMGSAHVAWCANRYRSYRAYDNTFQPNNGPRQQCYSPY